MTTSLDANARDWAYRAGQLEWAATQLLRIAEKHEQSKPLSSQRRSEVGDPDVDRAVMETARGILNGEKPA